MSYGINDIEIHDFREGVRLRIPMYLGTDDIEGIYQALKEIINNSTDEALEKPYEKLEITVNEKLNKVSVRDYGRGCPFGIREDGENVLVALFTKGHAGGKFNKNAYKNSSGLNGIGGSATNLSSKYFIVKSYRDGKSAIANFEKGLLKEYKESTTKEKNGTYVEFIPDEEVFINMEGTYSYDRICKDIRNISYLNKGLKFIVVNEETKEKKEYYSENGIMDYILDKTNRPLTKPYVGHATDGTDEIEVAFLWADGPEQAHVFVNGLYCPEGGSPVTGAKTTFTTAMKKAANEDLDGDLIRKGLVFAMSCKVTNPSFEGQVKSKINNPNLRTLSSKAFKMALDDFVNSNECDKIVQMLLKFNKAEKAAERARKQVLETAKEIEKNSSKKVFNSDKLKDAEFLGEDATLLIVEGDSAAGAMANARDYKHYGILAIRGKIINCLSNSEERIADNEEIKLLLKAMNIVPGKYNHSKLRYGRIAICTDADSDGYHIGLLIMSALFYLAPQFLLEDRLCWLRSPLYIVSNGKKESYYYNDEEFDAVRGSIKGDVLRAKGLGALSAEQAHNSMFTEEFQRMDVLKFDKESIARLEQLMGEDVTPRAEFLFNKVDFSTLHE